MGHNADGWELPPHCRYLGQISVQSMQNLWSGFVTEVEYSSKYFPFHLPVTFPPILYTKLSLLKSLISLTSQHITAPLVLDQGFTTSMAWHLHLQLI
jgi:hypothetical protein